MHAVTVGKGQMVAKLKPANAIPKMLAPKAVEEVTENAPEGGGRGTSSEDSPREPSPEDRENTPSRCNSTRQVDRVANGGAV